MKIADCHNDFLTKLSTSETIQYLIEAKQNNINAIVASVYTTEIPNNEVFDKIKFYNKLISLASIKPRVLLHIEDCWFLKNSADLNKLIQLKPFSCGLVWNEKNSLGCGANIQKGGLTEFGKYCAMELVKNNILVDFAHLNKESFYDLVCTISQPIFCSHTCFNGVNKHSRNLNDDQLMLLVKSNGLVGLTFVSNFLTHEPSANINDVVKQIIYFLDKFGEDNIAIGTDFYGTNNLPISLENYSNFNLLYNALLKAKINRSTIEKLFYKNFNFFLTRIRRCNN